MLLQTAIVVHPTFKRLAGTIPPHLPEPAMTILAVYPYGFFMIMLARYSRQLQMTNLTLQLCRWLGLAASQPSSDNQQFSSRIKFLQLLLIQKRAAACYSTVRAE